MNRRRHRIQSGHLRAQDVDDFAFRRLLVQQLFDFAQLIGERLGRLQTQTVQNVQKGILISMVHSLDLSSATHPSSSRRSTRSI